MKMLKLATLTTSACALALLLAAPSMAAPIINGSTLNISGSGIVSATSLTFQCNQPGDPVCASPPAGRGDFAVTNSTGSFSQYNGTFGLITSLNNAVQPLNTVFSLPNFITFNLNNNVTIELTFIPLGNNTVSATCAGLQHCTPQNPLLITPNNPGGLSAFNLDGTATGTTATFGSMGIAHSNDGFMANLTGTYTTQFAGMTPAEALAAALSGQPLSYSSQMVLTATTIPEPASMLLTGVALLGIGFVARKRK
jgi:hypothetical protein